MAVQYTGHMISVAELVTATILLMFYIYRLTSEIIRFHPTPFHFSITVPLTFILDF